MRVGGWGWGCSVWREEHEGGGGGAAYGERSMREGVGVQRMERGA